MAGTMTRRALVGGGAVGVLGAGAVVSGAVASGAVPGRTWLHGELRDRYHEWFGPHAHIPSAPEGRIRLEQVHSQARGKTVDLFTAVPHGHGDGAGLPVCAHGIWCGRSDPLYDDVRAFVRELPRRPQVLSYGDGAHTRAYWDGVPLATFAFLGGELGRAAA
jgi:hypothetical protein